MKNFKEIAEKCIAGELSGTFITAFGNKWHSSYLQKYAILGQKMPGQYILGPGVIYNEIGQCVDRERASIIDFIPDNMQEQIKIDIPEGKVPVMEQTEKGVVITWKEKELTYEDIVKTSKGNFPYSYVRDLLSLTGQQAVRSSAKTTEDNFYKKVEVLRKLTNIRNYFGLDPHRVYDWVIRISVDGTYYAGATKHLFVHEIVFSKQEHAEQAINMLGDELKYLFEPW